jgi:hypothetical protein
VPPPEPDSPAEPPAPPSAPEMSELSRLVNVFFSPKDAFADIIRRPRWWVPVILLSLAATAFTVAFANRVGYEQVVRQAIEQSPQASNMTPAQMERAIATGAAVMEYFSYGGAVLSVTISVFVVSAVLLFLFDTILGADIRLKHMLGIVGYAFLPNVLSYLLALLVLYLKAPEDFDIRNPLAFNAAIFLGGSPLWVQNAAASLDLFSFWIMALMAAGVHAASRKISWGKAFATILFPWALYVVLKGGYLYLRG